ncbi:MAG: gamma-glutamyltransferase [Cyanobacteria bacterium CRU_2_1]|nr:gamma-glutamyltransferase [Cyanobacteria bacterium CRU_2_1]
MLRLGGNAFDAAVAAVLASCVAEPMLSSLAGGGFLLAHTQDDHTILFDFFTQTPRQKKIEPIDFYPVDVNFGSVIQQFHIGLGSMAVPGTIGGMCHVHARLGRLPFSVVAEPAIHYARTGVEVNNFQAYCFKILTPILLASEAARKIYAPNGISPQSGEQLRLPELADTLTYLAAKGTNEFYKGDIAHQLVNDCQAQGGYLTLADLENYQVIERQPLAMPYRGNIVLTNPPPSSGGILIAFALALLSKVDLAQIEFGTAEHLCILGNVMRLTNLARKDGYDSYATDIAERFLAPEFLAEYDRHFSFVNTPVNKWGSTTHISVIDREGNAASVTTSNGEGSSYIIPGTGVMINNMLGEADLHPHGFHQWQENVRISSMMAPTLILDRHHQLEIVLGSGGSNRIRTAILQVISNLLDFKMPVDLAVGSPRVHWEDEVFNIEPGLERLTIARSVFPFNGQIELWEQQNMFFGGVHAVTQNSNRELAGAGDRRRGGAIGVLKGGDREQG